MNNNSDMAFIDHLEELRWRILKSLGSILVMAVLTFNFAGFVFFIWTLFNLLPRAISTHKWYLSEFKDYPKNRKIFIPYIF